MLDAVNAANPDWINLNGLPLEQQLVALRSAPLAGYYHQALITGIADGQGQGIDAAVDKPQTRTYQAIASQAGAVAVSYDDFFSAQIKPVAEATITENVSNYWKAVDPAISEADLEAKVADALANGAILANAGGPGVDVPVPSLTQAINAQLAQLSSHGKVYQGGLSIPNYLPASEEIGRASCRERVEMSGGVEWLKHINVMT